ncbi:hypothetical protein [Nocardioides panzhihuensis]|uniref:Uncharacterized protein n=1 Tax=Nocardioides panzhihuensis TaxID=860243 RepID=A0A7Z0DN92_9ACTN|nr:hypothetical protein [Nocardioides panzhihuensis]NYI78760.1 hypothetical protein [Nocardioides panzhihuensis]
MEKSGTQTPLSLAAAEAVRTYAATARSALDSAESPVISYAGLWLLLASLAPAAETETDEVLGLNRADARAAALALLEAPHPTIGAAVAGWLRPGVELTKALPVMLDPLPEQAGLDAWADEHTRGLITEFPLEIDSSTLLVFASALVVTPRWSEPLDDDGDGLLLLEGGFQAVVETEAAGPVAVACPSSEDGISVYSVVAADGVSAADVWLAADEVVRRIDSGEVRNRTFEPGTDAAGGHAWAVEEVTVFGGAPADRWRSHLPEWSAEDRHDLDAAPGVAEIARGVMAAVEKESEAACVQKAVASYDREGFEAAAVTGMMVRAGGAPRETTVRQIDLRFDRPHAVVAVARGGAWEGIPLFSSWVTPA